MAGKMEKATHQDGTEMETAVDTGNPHAKRPLDKKQGQPGADTSVSSKDPGKVFDSGKVAEQISAVFAGVEGLSEDFSSKATIILEGVLSEQVANLREAYQAEFEAKLEEQTAEIAAGFHDKLDSYLNYVVETFMQENAVAIENGIKSEIAEQVLESVVAIVESNGVTIPDDKIDVSEALATEVAQLETKLNEQIEKSLALTEQVAKYQVADVLAEASNGLSDASKEKLAKLAENISYKDIEDYKSRVNVLKDTLTEGVKLPAGKPTLTEEVKVADTVVVPSDRMKAYLAALQD